MFSILPFPFLFLRQIMCDISDLTSSNALRGTPHTRPKRHELYLSYEMIKIRLDKRSKFNSYKQNKKLYTVLLAPMWTHALKFYGTAMRSDLNHIQSLQ